MSHLARWRLRLSEFDFEVLHRAGVKQQPADTFLRPATNGEDGKSLENDISPLEINRRNFSPSQTSDNSVDSSQAFQSPALTEVLRRQARDTHCHMRYAQVGRASFELNFNPDGLLV